jgi:hypothetical protein
VRGDTIAFVPAGSDINWQPAATTERSFIFIKPAYLPVTKIKLFDFRYDGYDERFGTKSIGQFYVAEKNPFTDKQIKQLLKERFGL